MRKTLCALVLVLSLCGPAFAGDMGTPPLADCDISSQPLAAGDVVCPTSTTQTSVEETADGLAGVALTLLDSVLALL